jgi:putative membrane protein
MGPHHMDDWGMPFGFSNFGFGGIFMWILLIAIIAIAVYFFVKQSQGVRDESALDIAKKRYAKGEITKAELDEIKKNL